MSETGGAFGRPAGRRMNDSLSLTPFHTTFPFVSTNQSETQQPRLLPLLSRARRLPARGPREGDGERPGQRWRRTER